MEPQQTRRTFYSALIYGLGSLMGAAMALPAGVYLLVGAKNSRKGNWIPAASVSQLTTGKPQEVTFERTRVDGWRTFREKVITWVVKKDETNIVAFTPQCTHLGCAYHWEDQERAFVCPCHASKFSIDGIVTEGPAPRPLDQYAVRIENDKLLIGSEILNTPPQKG
jgi:menaquinol-cytochrome c reductase iron-sulfur subunit